MMYTTYDPTEVSYLIKSLRYVAESAKKEAHRSAARTATEDIKRWNSDSSDLEI